jgi:hypothetical protein
MLRSTRNSAGLIPAPEALPVGYFIHDNDTIVDTVDVTMMGTPRSITFTVFGPQGTKRGVKTTMKRGEST